MLLKSKMPKLQTARKAALAVFSLLLALFGPLVGPALAANNSITAPDTDGNVGAGTALVLDEYGYPIIAYYDDTNSNMKLMHCNDPDCGGGDESITSPDQIIPVTDSLLLLYRTIDLRLDSSGYPVILYNEIQVTMSELKLMHCNDVNCAGADESIVTVDTNNFFAAFASLALDSNGYPVVSYWDVSNDDLKLAHCNDTNCTGDDESIVAVVTSDAVGGTTSLALDSNGFPVISYLDGTSEDLKLVHCNDADCAGGDESIAAVDTSNTAGGFNSLVLDSNGYPVVSYWDFVNEDLKVAHCNDVNCIGGDESIVVVVTSAMSGGFTSLALDSSGYPVLSYFEATNEDLNVTHCNDANCAGSDESIVAVDTSDEVGGFNSLALDSNGNPVISYWDTTNEDLKVAHCGSATCLNSAPIAGDDGYSADEGMPLVVTAPGVLANDSDPDGDPLTASMGPQPGNGSVSMNPDGSFTFTPNPGFTGVETFSYALNDGSGGFDFGLVTITVKAVCPTFPVTVSEESELNEAITCYNDLTTPGSYAINLGAEIDLTASTTTINNASDGVELFINGAGFRVDGQDVSLSGNGRRPFKIAANTVVTMDAITITRGNSERGGGIWNAGSLTLSNSTLDRNRGCSSSIGDFCDDGEGGAIFNNGGIVNISTSTISNNRLGGDYNDFGGGGIHNTNGGSVNITHSQVVGNNAGAYGSDGGGIYNDSGTVSVNSSTFSQNDAGYDGDGGAIYNNSTLIVSNSTFSQNEGIYGGAIYNGSNGTATLINDTIIANIGGRGGGIYNSGQVMLSNSILANEIRNLFPQEGDEIWNANNGVIIADAHNLLGHSAQAPGRSFHNFTPGSSDIVATSDGTQPMALTDILDTTLQNNGGATETHALVEGSPAIDGGDNAICAAAPINNLDQRGVARPQSSSCDIGAFELEVTNNAPLAHPGGPYLSAVDTVVQFDSSGSTDPDGDPLTYAWTFGDGSSGSGAMPTHSYSETGIFDVCLTVNDGTVDSAEVCTIAVVYDPSGGFVTGGGWIDSPAGAYKPDPSLTGRATFGFVAKYKKGASIPTGNTAFAFDLVDFEFHSESYDWLVVNQGGRNAQFKGTGLINDAPDPNGNLYKFMVWAGDDTPDTFRIRIWWEDSDGTEYDVYDNGSNQPIGGGNIVVHKAK